MTTSNEPGYYEDGSFGIRIENVCITVRADTPNRFRSDYCRFETITLCPLQLSLVHRPLLSACEVDWINAYHREVREKLLPLMSETFPDAVEFLLRQTEELA
jgi:Xaa-Pro aminopeptidase